MADQPTMDTVIQAYLTLRAQKEKMVARQKEEVAPLNQQIQQCAAWLHQQLLSQGQTNARTASGSCFLQTDTAAVVEDWDLLLSWVRVNNLFEFLEQRVSKSVVTDYIESTNTTPPGVKVTRSVSCHVRK